MTLMQHTSGGYQFLPGGETFSDGVSALSGYELVRVTLHQLVPYQQAFSRIQQHLASIGRPLAALCSVELRSPAPFTLADFAAFNQEYQHMLSAHGLLLNGHNPLARTNVVPAMHAPAEPVLYAFSYSVPAQTSRSIPPTFVTSGAGEVRGRTLKPDAIVRYGETSIEALREKAIQVMNIMSSRLSRLRVSWAATMEASIYTVHPLQPFLATEILDTIGQASVHGIHWFYSRPPVEGLEFEMDIRSVRQDARLE